MNKKIFAIAGAAALLLVGLVTIGVTAYETASTEAALDQEARDIADPQSGALRILWENDLDGDGIANCEDADDDGDGINDTADTGPFDHDNDGIPDWKDDDDDNDGIPDTEDDHYVGDTQDFEDLERMIRSRLEQRGNGHAWGHRERIRDAAEKARRLMRRVALNDLDGDGIANCEDPDDDGDGMNDTVDAAPFDHDNDGSPDFRDLDDDNDGIPDDEDDYYAGNCPNFQGHRGSGDNADLMGRLGRFFHRP